MGIYLRTRNRSGKMSLLLLLLLPLLLILILCGHHVILALLERLIDRLFQEGVSLFQVVIDNDPVVGPLLPCVLHLLCRHGQTLLDGFLGFGASAYQPLLEGGKAWGRDEDEDGVQRRVVGLDEFYALGVDVEDGAAGVCASVCFCDAGGGDVSDGFGGGSVAVASELSVFEEGARLHQRFEFVSGDVVVRLASDFSWTRITGGVYNVERR